MGKGVKIQMAVALLLALPAVGAAQAVVADALPCSDSEGMGSLGITGIECERCQFITGEGPDRAVFYTEPVIRGIRPEAPSSRVLREGDVLVAIDGHLITTSAGWERFSNLPAQSSVTVRVRRDGRVLELRVPLMSVCREPGDAPSPVIAGRAVPAPPRPDAVESVRVGVVRPAPDASPIPPTAPSVVVERVTPPTAPSLHELPPRASLGFGFQCGHCSYDGEAWEFTDHPLMQAVPNGSSAWHAGLRSADRIVAIDGVDILTPEGGRRFAGIQPGDSVTWSVDRLGERIEVTTVASDPNAPRARSMLSPADGPVRFTGTVGETTVEVRGGRVSVTESEDGDLIVIQTGDTVIRIRASGRER